MLTSNMTDKMLKFVKLGQQNPAKRKVLERKEDFNEIYREFINEKAEPILNKWIDIIIDKGLINPHQMIYFMSLF